jgi:glucose-6-phosphate 1-dehydrogenase
MTEPVSTLLILGATGDLSHRLLMPGLGGLLANGEVDLSLVGAGVEDWTQEQWHERVLDSFHAAHATGKHPTAVANASTYFQADVTATADLRTVLDACTGVPAIFFALPPAVTEKACTALLDVQLPAGTRLVLEKPFGTDQASAHALNELLVRLVPEDHIHRVDHFLGKSTVLNLLGLRFANRLLEPLLCADHVDRVEIVFDEALGLEGRAGYYDTAGALRDMIQSHLLQILAVLTMEPPPTLSAEDLRSRKAAVLRATRVYDDDPVRYSRRARWTAGVVAEQPMAGYADSPGVKPSRNTETLAEVTFTIDNWRWAGVPFVVRSGKAIGAPRKEAIVTFKPAPRIPDGFHGDVGPDQLIVGFGPDLARLRIYVNGPGDPHELDPVDLVSEFGPGGLSAYGEVLEGVLEGDPSLSVRGDTAEQCWRIVQPVLDAWAADEVPLEEYPAGTAGPARWTDD